MTTKRMGRKDVESKLSCDQLTFSKGVFTARWGFFYTNGHTAEMFASKVQRVFPDATILDQGEVWKPFKGGASTAAQSHWYVKFSFPRYKEVRDATLQR